MKIRWDWNIVLGALLGLALGVVLDAFGLLSWPTTDTVLWLREHAVPVSALLFALIPVAFLALAFILWAERQRKDDE